MPTIKTQTLSLGDYWNQFIAAEIAKGRYNSASEIVRDALRLLENNQANHKLNILRASLIEGEESPNIGPLNIEAIKKQAKQKNT